MATCTLLSLPIPIAWGTNSTTSPLAILTVYLAGSSTLTTIYADVNAQSTLLNPLTADTNGRFPEVFLTPGTAVKINLTDASGNPLPGYPADNVMPTPASANYPQVSGIAGEALTAGNGVYLSDGSGGKTAGSWYKWDSANAYSSTLPMIGMVPASIASGSSGTIQQGGLVSGLSLSVGLDYYIGTAGALTSTVPTFARHVGRADTATSLVMATDAPPTLVNPQIAQGRLTLTTGTPITTGDVSGATTIYYTPYLGNVIALYDGTATWNLRAFSEISQSLGTLTSGLPYDIFAYDNNGVVTLEMLAWATSTSRATALVLQNGVQVKTGATTRRWLGTFFTTSTTQTEDSETKRYVFNAQNRVRRPLGRIETTSSWAGNGTNWRQTNGSASNQVGVMIGLSEIPVHVSTWLLAGDGTSVSAIGSAIGIDSTSTPASHQIGMMGSVVSTSQVNGIAQSIYDGYPGVGQHLLQWLERAGDGSNVSFKSNQSSAYEQSGMIGWCDA